MKINFEVETNETEEKVYSHFLKWIKDNFFDLDKVKFEVIGTKTIKYNV